MLTTTYANLRELSKLHKGLEDLEDLAEYYQFVSDEGKRRVIFAKVFCDLYPLIYLKCEKFFGITDADKASFATEELHKCLLAFDGDRGTKFSSLYYNFLENRLISETQYQNNKKRRGNQYLQSYDSTISHGEEEVALMEVVTACEETGYDNAEFLESLAMSTELTDNELKYCEIVTGDTSRHTDTEIATILGISSAAVHYIKKSLQRKMSSVLAC